MSCFTMQVCVGSTRNPCSTSVGMIILGEVVRNDVKRRVDRLLMRLENGGWFVISSLATASRRVERRSRSCWGVLSVFVNTYGVGKDAGDGDGVDTRVGDDTEAE